jgi:hypothetical protein
MLAQQAVVLGHCKRTANGIEKLLSSGTGTSESPAVPSFEGEINYIDVNLAMGWVF